MVEKAHDISGLTCVTCPYWFEMDKSAAIAARGLGRGIRLGQCQGAPPIPVISGMAQQGPQMTMMYPRLPDNFPACAKHPPKDEAVAEEKPVGESMPLPPDFLFGSGKS